MRLLLGYNFFEVRDRKSSPRPIVMDTTKLINGHMLVLGASGVGKSYALRDFIRQACAQPNAPRFHVFDVHGDLSTSRESVVSFSEASPYGLNPLRINPDPEFGGVRKCIQTFIRTLNQASTTPLGVKQEAVLRNILGDVFRDFGFDPDDPMTWQVNEYASRMISGGRDNRLYLEVPFADIEKVKALGARFDPSVKHWWIPTERYVGDIRRWPPAYRERNYPSLNDVTAYARRLHVERFLGSDQKAVQALATLNKKARSMQRKFLEEARHKNQETLTEDFETEIENARTAAVAAYSDYVQSIRTGFELESLMKYDSPDVLKSVEDRLSNLKATGIFKSTAPVFDEGAPVWRYRLNSLSLEEKKMTVLFLLHDLFSKATQRGETPQISDVLVIDELGTYVNGSDDSGDGIIGTIARQARKFGVALWAADQSPEGVPKGLFSSVGSKIVLGLDETTWASAQSKLRIDPKQLAWIQSTVTLAAQLKERGALQSAWQWVSIKAHASALKQYEGQQPVSPPSTG